MSLENVRAFYQRLATDETFRTQLQQVNSKDECSQVVQAAGYSFSQEEFEDYTAQLLESNLEEGELQDLDEKELEAVFGGARFPELIKPWQPQPLYGVIRPPWPQPQPLYGVILFPSE